MMDSTITLKTIIRPLVISAVVLFRIASANAATFSVTNNFDSGTGSLRDAIANANALAGADTIQFDTAGVFATPQTIYLAGALPAITDSLTITGPGAAQLTVRRDSGGDYRIFTLMVDAPGAVTISGLTIANGFVNGLGFPDAIGGGVANLSSGTANVSDCILTGNSADAGGAISSVHPNFDPAITTNVTNCVLNNNSAGEGGAIWNGGTLTVTHSTLAGNTATTSGDGGGITQLGIGSTVVTDSTISGNSALDSSGFGSGGGIHNNSTVTIIRSTISDNSAGNNGGAISNNSGTLTITNSTVSGNTAGVAGGGISNFSNGTLTIMNTTVAGNGATFGGGIDNEHFVDDGMQVVILKSSIITASTVGSDVRGTITSQGYNLISDASGAIISPATGDQIGVPAAQLNLGPLQYNGGPTQTIALGCGSVAIDKGISNSLSNDQRGLSFVRTFDDPAISNAADGTDVGAFELQTPCGGPTPTPTPEVSRITPAGRTCSDFATGVAPSFSTAEYVVRPHTTVIHQVDPNVLVYWVRVMQRRAPIHWLSTRRSLPGISARSGWSATAAMCSMRTV